MRVCVYACLIPCVRVRIIYLYLVFSKIVVLSFLYLNSNLCIAVVGGNTLWALLKFLCMSPPMNLSAEGRKLKKTPKRIEHELIVFVNNLIRAI